MEWSRLRVYFLATLTGILAVLVLRIQLFPSPKKPALTKSVLPGQIQLPKWQLLATHELLESQSFGNGLEGRHYKYQYLGYPLSIDLHYLIDIAHADVRIWLSHFTKIPIDLEIRQHPIHGYYGLTQHQQTAYLVSCIPPRGKSSVTAHQYKSNTYAHFFSQSDVLNRLLGRNVTPWVDDRCLWTILSTPVQARADTDLFLEQAWVTWYQWWVKHYPSLKQIRRGA